MPHTELKYGSKTISVNHAAERFVTLGTKALRAGLSDVEMGVLLDSPIGTPPLEDVVEAGESVLIVVPDATRQTASGQVVNLLVRRLIAAGIAPFDIRIIFATGIHRKVTAEERPGIITSFIEQRVKTLDHDARDLARIVRMGETSGGIPIELDRSLVEHDRVILVGGVSFHYFAGFTGGRKLICPGLASSRTVRETHKLAFDSETQNRRSGVDTGILDGNAVHEAFIEAVRKVDPAFAVSTIVNDAGDAVDLFCGHWDESHRKACEKYAQDNIVYIDELRDLVIVSCGGRPHDMNMIQAHKALDTAARACRDGGTIVLIAECPEGMGRADFLAWFDSATSVDLGKRLAEKYKVNGQTAWSLLRKAERVKVKIVTDISASDAKKMRLDKIDVSFLRDLAASSGPEGYIIPEGARVLIRKKG